MSDSNIASARSVSPSFHTEGEFPGSSPLAQSHADDGTFQAMLEAGGEGEGGIDPSFVGYTGPLDMARRVDSAHHEAQSKVLRASISPRPENIYEASVALSKYDLQTLFLSKVANKTFQAVDRLTNLQ